MPRIKLEESLLADGRFIAVIQKIGQTKAFGDYVRLCFLAQNYWRRHKCLIPRKIYEDQDFPDEFILYDLVVEKDDGYYLRGSNKHFDWLFEKPDSVMDLGKKVAKKKASSPEKSVSMNFLDEEQLNFISGVSDRLRSRWLRDYSEETIENKLEAAMQWCASKNKVPDNVGLLMNKFFQNVPKDGKNRDCPLDEAVQNELNSILEEGKKKLEDKC